MTNAKPQLTRSSVIARGTGFLMAGTLTAAIALIAGLQLPQIFACSIFVMIVTATMLFWEYRLAITFIGIAALLGSRALTLQSFIASTELDIILFLVGMMIAVGVLKDLGLFTWVIQMVLNTKKMNGTIFVLTTIFVSAFMACVVGEVPSMVFMSALIFHVCDTLKVKPLPFLIISVIATNIGSAGTMLGNPVGILLGSKAGFTFGDFLLWAFPIMLLTLVIVLFTLLWWYRREIKNLSERLESRRLQGLGLGPLVPVPYKRALAILIGMMALIALHHNIEQLLGVAKNTILIVTPLFISGTLMIWRHDRARHYVEHEVEWWTLLFFMMLFAVAGALAHTGVTTRIAEGFLHLFGTNVAVLTPIIILLSAAGSALLDNVVFVAAFIPIVREIGSTPLWWALLFGACFGGNITMIGSTANIVALGMLEKRYRTQVKFGEWLKTGLVIGAISCATAWAGLAILTRYMPEIKLEPEHIGLVEHP